MAKRKGLQGQISVGGDKSISHRVVMLAAMAHGMTKVKNLSSGADVKTTLALYQRLGMQISSSNGTIELLGKGVESLKSTEPLLYCGNSGTTLRLSMGILAGAQIECSLAGDDSLNRRPVHRVIEPLKLMGGNLETSDGGDRPPVLVHGKRLHGVNYSTSVASAQVKSAILLAGLHAEGVTSITEPQKSRDHTEIIFKYLGCNIDVAGNTVILGPTKNLRAFDYDIPGDISTAVFFIVAALIIPNSTLVIKNVLLNPTRTGALEILRSMGADITEDNIHDRHGEPVGDLIVRSSQLHGFDAADIISARFIDEVPALAVAAMFADGETTFRNVGELRVKESNRAKGIANVLAAFGGNSTIDGDDLHIHGTHPSRQLQADHHNDHRLAMMIEIISLALTGNVSSDYSEVISVSAPEFYDQLSGVAG